MEAVEPVAWLQAAETRAGIPAARAGGRDLPGLVLDLDAGPPAASRTPKSCLSADRGHVAIDRALYVPRSWTEDPDRCRSAGVPDGLAFATKPQLAARMVERALDAGTPARWVAGDEVYGDNPHLRTALEQRRTGYVLAVSSTHPVITHAGKLQAKTLAGRIPKRAWQRLSAGAGAKGERYYEMAQIEIHGPAGRLGQ